MSGSFSNGKIDLAVADEGIKESSFRKCDKKKKYPLIMADGDAQLLLLDDAVKNEKEIATVLILQLHINLHNKKCPQVTV